METVQDSDIVTIERVFSIDQVSEPIFNGTSTYSAIHVGSCLKIQDRRQIKYTDDIETKHNPEKANKVKHSKTKLPCPGLVIFYDTRSGNEVGLFYNAPKPMLSNIVVSDEWC